MPSNNRPYRGITVSISGMENLRNQNNPNLYPIKSINEFFEIKITSINNDF